MCQPIPVLLVLYFLVLLLVVSSCLVSSCFVSSWSGVTHVLIQASSVLSILHAMMDKLSCHVD
jgi:hypothetical protein